MNHLQFGLRPVPALVASFRHRFAARAPAVFAFGVLTLMLASLAACAPVAPYERGTLAHPTMTTEDMATSFDGHVRAVSEGGSGGIGGGGGGCGCN